MAEYESNFEEFYSPIDFSCENKLEKYSRKTQDLINELIHTEVVYVDRLNRTVTHYARLQEENNARLQEEKDAQNTVVLAQDEIYFKLLELRHFHTKLLAEIRAAQGDSTLLAKVFIRSENKFAMYLTYDKLYQNICHTRLVHKQKRSEILENYNISNYLKEPNKRLPSYLIIFTELLKFRKKFESEVEKNKDEISHEKVMEVKDSASVQAAVDVIKDALRIMKIAKVLDTIVDCPININSQGHLLRHDKFEVTNPQNQTHPMMCSLFEHVLIFSVESQQGSKRILLYHDLIHMRDLGLSPPRNEDAVSFSVWYRKRTFKNYSLHADVSTQKDWVEDITRLLVNAAVKDRDVLRGLSRTQSMKESSEVRKRNGEKFRFGLSWFSKP